MDGLLPEIICNDCMLVLTSLFRFRQRCLKTSTYLNDIVKKFRPEHEHNLENMEIVEPKEPKEEINTTLLEEDNLSNASELNDDSSEFDPEYLEDSDESNTQEITTNPIIEPTISTDDMVECNNCKKEFSKFTFIMNHAENCFINKCKHCTKCFKTKTALQHHNRVCVVRNWNPPEEEESLVDQVHYMCEICNTNCPDKDKLLDHFYEHVSVATYFDYQTTDKLYSCYACPKKNISEFQNHFQNHAVFKCKMCSGCYNEVKELKQHMLTHGILPHVCQNCLISFDSDEKTRIHLLSHNKKKPEKVEFRCEICEKKFISQSFLKEHIKIHYKNVFECPNCDNMSTDILSFQEHKELHTAASLCPACGAQFESKTLADQHYRKTHIQRERLICFLCQHSFNSLQGLKNHQLRHSQLKPHTCSHPGCDYRSSQKTDVRVHERTHSDSRPYKCTVEGCNVAFKTSSHKMAHIRRHSGIRNYDCLSCSMKFSSSTQLKSHSVTHIKDYPYTCGLCDKSFRMKRNLTKHEATHFQDECLVGIQNENEHDV